MDNGIKIFFKHSTFATISGLLLYCAFHFYGGWPMAIPAIILLLRIIDKTDSPSKRCIYESLFFLTFISLQFFFVIDKTFSGNHAIILINFIVFGIHIIPVWIFSSFKSIFRAELLLVGIFTAELLFTNVEIGNNYFQLGILYADTPEFIQWFEYTGIYGGTLWMLITCYLIFKWIYYNSLNLFLIIVIIAFPAVTSLCMKKSENNSTVNTIILSLAENKDFMEAFKSLDRIDLRHIDFIILPEGAISSDENVLRYNPYVTAMQRTSKKYGLSISAGVFSYSSNKMSNSILIFNNGEILRRYKQHMIPFSEYLPWYNFLSKFNFIQENMLYPLNNKENKNQIYCFNESFFTPLICYEAHSVSYVTELVKNGCEIFLVSSSNSYINSRHLEKVSEKVIRSIAVTVQRSFARAAEHGVSFFSDDNGYTVSESWVKTGISCHKMGVNGKLSLYAKYERLIINLYLAAILLSIIVISMKYRPERKG